VIVAKIEKDGNDYVGTLGEDTVDYTGVKNGGVLVTSCYTSDQNHQADKKVAEDVTTSDSGTAAHLRTDVKLLHNTDLPISHRIDLHEALASRAKATGDPAMELIVSEAFNGFKQRTRSTLGVLLENAANNKVPSSVNSRFRLPLGVFARKLSDNVLETLKSAPKSGHVEDQFTLLVTAEDVGDKPWVVKGAVSTNKTAGKHFPARTDFELIDGDKINLRAVPSTGRAPSVFDDLEVNGDRYRVVNDRQQSNGIVLYLEKAYVPFAESEDPLSDNDEVFSASKPPLNASKATATSLQTQVEEDLVKHVGNSTRAMASATTDEDIADALAITSTALQSFPSASIAAIPLEIRSGHYNTLQHHVIGLPNAQSATDDALHSVNVALGLTGTQ
jgi:hypothetical protein